MQIDVSIFMSVVSLILAGIVGITGIVRNSRRDNVNDTTQLTTVIVKLENIGDDIRDIKSDMKSVKDDVQSHAERLVKVEQQIKVLNNTVFKGGGAT